MSGGRRSVELREAVDGTGVVWREEVTEGANDALGGNVGVTLGVATSAEARD